MVGLLVAAAALGAATPATIEAPLPNADPAIFVVRDPDTTVYIFGTFHALDGKSEWFNGQVRTAFDNSSELVLETLVPEAPKPFAPPPPRLGMTVAPSASFLATTRMIRFSSAIGSAASSHKAPAGLPELTGRES